MRSKPDTDPEVAAALRKCERAQRRYLNGSVNDKEKLKQKLLEANREYSIVKYGRAMTVPEVINHLKK